MLKKKGISCLLLTCAFIATSSLVFGDLRTAQIGEVSIPNNYAGGVRANEGFFFTFQFLYWQLPNPKDATVGELGVAGNPVYWNSHPYAAGSYLKGQQQNTWNDGSFGSNWEVGQRYTFGFMNEHWGWDIQIFTLDSSTCVTANGIQVGFNDLGNGYAPYLGGTVLRPPSTGDATKPVWENYERVETLKDGERLGVVFAKAKMFNEIETWGVEFNMLRRSHATCVGIFEFGLGVRYLKWDESFGFQDMPRYAVEPKVSAVDGGDDDDDDGGGETVVTEEGEYIRGVLDGSYWRTRGTNHLVGPQLGVRWFRSTGRFSVGLSGKFAAAYNAQCVKQAGVLGSRAPAGYDFTYQYGENMTGQEDTDPITAAVYQPNIPAGGLTVTDRKQTFNEFTPLFEFGVNMDFQLTRKISFQLGWTGIYAMDMLRPMSMVDYTLAPDYIFNLKGDGKENVFVHGFNFGILINR